MKQTFESKFSFGEIVKIISRRKDEIVGVPPIYKNGTIVSVKFTNGKDTPTYSLLMAATEDIRLYDEKDILAIDNYPEITIEDVKKWKKELDESNVKSRWFGIGTKMTMDNHIVYFNGPIYGSCTRQIWDSLLKEAIENLGK